ncbi:Predicted flavoprotein CzcO associated with the cation diffusion facilitator CzcD [Saccharopolyspora antimicrobica]|uniref:Cation diffusion facilitator CzcD-associated flavoprotein CzcO n=1 Tax=Saccharopolyspora antimicrobica TaxID=455193 RepID=A0A1I4QQR8_9PSEU|nr:NAD(P)-binding domain-containing protein [Saccharopolyspora antimicrobica]RKT88347.1 cation diffusion facilitator CzcD-associated flavoprotein CzcO [Saccharopolyspora antimicrobica]SFM42033.1 Predicted flavoprotein CzcO associated with the cation diffusion facilitator CzcD [Saccharopolyspora antimicrobica]
MQLIDAVVIGAGQAGLTASYHLQRTGIDHVLLDRGSGPGGAWRNRWPSLRLGGVHGIHSLPGSEFSEADGARPAAEVVAEYFGRYEHELALPVLRPVKVDAVRDGGERLLVESSAGTWVARAVINATGTWENPFWPHYPGQQEFTGRQLHTADYRGPEEFRGQHVVVVGGGISAVEHLLEISEVAGTTWVTRRPPHFTDATFTPEDGRAAVAEVERRVRAGLPPGSVVSVTGLPNSPAVLAARERGVLDRLPMFQRITADGVAWADGTAQRADVILWATGFRPAIAHLAPLNLRAPGGGIQLDGTRAVAEPRLHLVGYGPSASTIGANRAGRAAAHAVRAEIKNSLSHPVQGPNPL